MKAEPCLPGPQKASPLGAYLRYSQRGRALLLLERQHCAAATRRLSGSASRLIDRGLESVAVGESGGRICHGYSLSGERKC